MLSSVLQWMADNVEGLLAIFTILAAIISLLTKAGFIQKERGDSLTRVLENGEDVAKRTINQLRAEKKKKAKAEGKKEEDVELGDLEIAAAFAKAMKGEARQEAIKSGFRSVVQAVANGAAETDPKKKAPGPLKRLGGLIRSRIPFLDRAG